MPAAVIDRASVERMPLRNAGYLVFHQVFNGDELVSTEIVVDKGPHPNAGSGFTLFCDLTTEALGLSYQLTPSA